MSEAKKTRRPFKPLIITVVTYDLDERETDRRDVDWSGEKGKDWLAKHIVWATLNAHFIEVLNKEDLERIEKKGG